MHTTAFIFIGCSVFVMVMTYVLAGSLKRSIGEKTGTKLLPPDEFCKRVLEAKPQRMIILHVGGSAAALGQGRRYEFRAEEPKSGRSFRTYFDDAAHGSGRPLHRPHTPNTRRTAGRIQLLMQAAMWHADRRKGTLKNPAYYLEP